MNALKYTFLLFALLLLNNCSPKQETAEKLPNDYLYRQRANANGEVDKQAYIKALDWRKARMAEKQIENRSGSDWELAGPTNVGGRITDLEMLSDDMNTIFAAAASGGIFRSDDRGENWRPIFDEAGSLSIGDMAFAPSDEQVIYVGTGEANAGGNSLAYDGLGVYRSNDQGETWDQLGLEDVGSIGKVIVAHDDPERVYVAAMGTLFADNEARGVYRSDDGGTSWEQVLYRSPKTGAIDLAIHPENSDIIYAAMWERVRRPDLRAYGGPTSGIFRSMDGGDTWEELTNGLPTAAAQKGRIGIAIAPSAPNVLYAMYTHGEGGDLEGVFRSDDGGESWRRLDSDDIYAPPYMWWFGKIFVNPNNPENVFVTSFDMYESKDGGNSWRLTGNGMHVDQHSVVVHPMDENLRIYGNDGGVYVNDGATENTRKLINMPITQFYRCAIDYQNPERLYGGTQDNGTQRTSTGELGNWEHIYGGDGFTPLIDPTDSEVIYAQWQYGGLGRSDNGGQNFRNLMGDIPNSARINWNMPTTFEPGNSNTLYIGAQRVYKSENRGNNWTPISPDLTNGATSGNLVFATLTSLSVSPLNTDVIYAGTDDGNVQLTTNGGEDWTLVSEDLPVRWVTRVFTSPTAENTAYVTFSGYRYGAQQGHVFKTDDFGNTWTDISSNLPDIPVNDILLNPVTNLLYLATDIGVFVANEEGDTWDLLGEDLPNVVVNDLKLHEPTQLLVAATYGRSLYKIDIAESTPTQEVASLDAEITAYPNPFQAQLNLDLELDTPSSLHIELYDIHARKLRSLFEGKLPSGKRTFQWNAGDLASGTYFCKLQSGDKMEVLKVVKE